MANTIRITCKEVDIELRTEFQEDHIFLYDEFDKYNNPASILFARVVAMREKIQTEKERLKNNQLLKQYK